ncbi:hypothetical protein SUGI_0901940 [Cryptomeria japonica]|nr:hypothetical protein SUGI_0901940 [Cryptomeria japonica]
MGASQGRMDKGNPGAAGYGSIIRDEKGTILGSISGSLGIASNNEVEAMALVRGLKYYSEQNYQNRNLDLFRRILSSKDIWLSNYAAVHVVEIGENMAVILQYIGV